MDGITINQKIKAFDMSGNTSFMKKISGTITNTPPPLPKDGNMYHMAVRSGSPIEGVKITDGEKVVFSDKNGFYEIETDKRNIEFSKENYAKETFDTNFPIGMPFKKNIVLKKSEATITETKSTSEEKMLFGFKQKFLVNVALVLGVVGLGWYYYKSKKLSV